MNELINKAIGKITDEMMQSNDPAITAIEEHLTSICTNSAVAACILTEGKTLKGALKAIEDAARKSAKGNCGYIAPDEGFGIVEKYYGISTANNTYTVSSQSTTIDIMDFMI